MADLTYCCSCLETTDDKFLTTCCSARLCEICFSSLSNLIDATDASADTANSMASCDYCHQPIQAQSSQVISHNFLNAEITKAIQTLTDQLDALTAYLTTAQNSLNSLQTNLTTLLTTGPFAVIDPNSDPNNSNYHPVLQQWYRNQVKNYRQHLDDYTATIKLVTTRRNQLERQHQSNRFDYTTWAVVSLLTTWLVIDLDQPPLYQDTVWYQVDHWPTWHLVTLPGHSMIRYRVVKTSQARGTVQLVRKLDDQIGLVVCDRNHGNRAAIFNLDQTELDLTLLFDGPSSPMRFSSLRKVWCQQYRLTIVYENAQIMLYSFDTTGVSAGGSVTANASYQLNVKVDKLACCQYLNHAIYLVDNSLVVFRLPLSSPEIPPVKLVGVSLALPQLGQSRMARSHDNTLSVIFTGSRRVHDYSLSELFQGRLSLQTTRLKMQPELSHNYREIALPGLMLYNITDDFYKKTDDQPDGWTEVVFARMRCRDYITDDEGVFYVLY